MLQISKALELELELELEPVPVPEEVAAEAQVGNIVVPAENRASRPAVEEI